MLGSREKLGAQIGGDAEEELQIHEQKRQFGGNEMSHYITNCDNMKRNLTLYM
jgi:hypothetical protein